MTDFSNIAETLRKCGDSCAGCEYEGEMGCITFLHERAANAIADLSYFYRMITALPDCNTCLKKNMCEFLPKYGEYCRINCHAYLGEGGAE